MASTTNNNNNNFCAFVALPTELITEITRELKLSDLVPLAQTARRFNNILTPTIHDAALRHILRDGSTTVLQWAASRGLARLADRLVELDPELESFTVEQYRSTLELAAQQGLRSTVELLFKTARLDPVEDGWKPLHEAASAGHAPVARFLIDNGVDAYTVQKRGYNPMHGVGARGDLEMARLLLDAGATVSREVSRFGRTSIHYAAAAGHREMVEFLLRAGANISSVDVHRRTVLFNAAVAGIHDVSVGSRVVIPTPGVGNAEVIRLLLLSLGVDPSLLDLRGMSVMHAVCERAYIAELNALIDSGVDLAIRDLAGFTPLHHAVYAGHKQVVEILLAAGADISAVDGHGRTLLHIAAIAGQDDLVRLLLSKKPDLCSVRDSDGWTPLHHAAYEAAHGETFNLLFHANNNNNNNNNNTQFSLPEPPNPQLTLHKAVQENNPSMITFLIDSGVSPSTPKTYWSPLDVAIANDHTHLVKLLLSHGVDPNSTPENVHYTPLHRASEHGNDEAVRLLLEAGANASRATDEGETPLHSASFAGNLAIVKRLVDAGAPINAQDVRLSTPLHEVLEDQATAGQDEVALFLVERGADLSITDKVGNTALHNAAWGERHALIEPLIAAGADPDLVGQQGLTVHGVLDFGMNGY